MNARITVSFFARDICEPQDLVDAGMTFEAMVRDFIESEGLLGIADMEQILSVEEVPDEIVDEEEAEETT